MSELKRHSGPASLCPGCSKLCRHACPVAAAEGREAFTPTAKARQWKSLVEGHSDWTPESVEPLYACTGCRAHQDACSLDVDVSDALFDARDRARREGVAPEAVRRQRERYAAHGRPWREDLGALLAEAVPKARVGAAADVQVHAGCAALRRAPELVRALAGVLDAARVDWSFLPPACTGYPLWALGNHDLFEHCAGAFAAQLDRPGTLVCLCPACVETVQVRYPAMGLRPRMQAVHAAVFVDGLLRDGALTVRNARPLAPVFHDPCRLGREQGHYDEPRRVLSRVVAGNVRELPGCRAHGRCCGGGGGLPALRPDTARTIAAARIAEARAGGSDALVTACPTCRVTLSRAAVDLSRAAEAEDSFRVVDLIELLYEAL